ncbi:hypothetical protein D3C81_1582610 [compost metagenome]
MRKSAGCENTNTICVLVRERTANHLEHIWIFVHVNDGYFVSSTILADRRVVQTDTFVDGVDRTLCFCLPREDAVSVLVNLFFRAVVEHETFVLLVFDVAVNDVNQTLDALNDERSRKFKNLSLVDHMVLPGDICTNATVCKECAANFTDVL